MNHRIISYIRTSKHSLRNVVCTQHPAPSRIHHRPTQLPGINKQGLTIKDLRSLQTPRLRKKPPSIHVETNNPFPPGNNCHQYPNAFFDALAWLCCGSVAGLAHSLRRFVILLLRSLACTTPLAFGGEVADQVAHCCLEAS